MTAAPEPRTSLALVATVVAPQRIRPVTLGNVSHGLTHRLACHRHIHPAGITTLCPQSKEKTYVQHHLPFSSHHCEMRRYNDDLDR